jgi:molybdate transport system permease protein
MPLVVEISKQLPGHGLRVSLEAGKKPAALLGASGSGKTMTLRCIAGLVRPDRGRIILNDRVLFDSETGIDVPSRKRRIGLLFQHYALFPHMNAAQNIAFGLADLAPAEREARVRKQIEQTHLGGLKNRYPRELSGGEQQRVALARALAIEPEALLLDEPFSALDTHLRSQLEQQLIETLTDYRGVTLFVTHNIEEAYRICSDLVVLSQGQTIASGLKEEIFRYPPSFEVARVTGCKNFSRTRPISSDTVEALDWACRLRVEQPIARPAAFIGIRAHHIGFAEGTTGENTLPCWLVRASETPFRITLYLKLHAPPKSGEGHHLQAEVFKEKWMRFKDRPFPWMVHLAPGSLFLLPE